jgi:hypothetical protein
MPLTGGRAGNRRRRLRQLPGSMHVADCFGGIVVARPVHDVPATGADDRRSRRSLWQSARSLHGRAVRIRRAIDECDICRLPRPSHRAGRDIRTALGLLHRRVRGEVIPSDRLRDGSSALHRGDSRTLERLAVIPKYPTRDDKPYSISCPNAGRPGCRCDTTPHPGRDRVVLPGRGHRGWMRGDRV